MLRLIDVTKVYSSGDSEVHALKGISISFRKNEFVSILGHSGCGKTTLLNIVGGLDKYTSGDLIVEGVSTKEYKDRDWDNYRNHSIGFVFQSYNLIPHQTVLGNVELALTLSGVNRSDRRMLAQAALVKVGLADQLHKLPNQLSGGQMQRVAIARALVNDPDIILADEPTGALDTETSLQIMEILKEVAKEKLVIMVTHNPELAEKYSTRIVRLKDGEVVDDTMPYDESAEMEAPAEEPSMDEAAPASSEEVPDEAMEELIKEKDKADEVTRKVARSKKKPSMSLFTAFALSIRNLFTKKGRTFLTAFAGSIGIIGIALILSLSNGFRNYIAQVEEDTLAGYPIVIRTESNNVGFEDLMEAFMPTTDSDGEEKDPDTVRSYPLASNLLKKMRENAYRNDLRSFRTWLMTEKKDVLDKITNSVSYTYDTDFNVYKCNELSDGTLKVQHLYPFTSDNLPSEYSSMKGMMDNLGIWAELVTNQKYLDQQYEVIAGAWPKQYESTDNEVFEVVLTVDKNNAIYDYLLWAIGYMTLDEIFNNKEAVAKSYKFDEFIGAEYKIVLPAEQYVQAEDKWVKQVDGDDYKNFIANQAITIRISGIIRPRDGVTTGSMQGVIGYTEDLTKYMIERIKTLPVVQAQMASTDKNVLSGAGFESERDYISALSSLGVADIEDPSSIKFFVKGFDEKDKVIALINEYNDLVRETDPDLVIRYNDSIGSLMSSINTIIDAISYVLIAFVSISLIVSSIMIGIITYISVLERTKEIGVLRSIGASKRDISRLFNAETLTIGFMSGVIGIIVTLLLIIPINLIISSLTGIATLGASLPVLGGVALVIISMFLSFIAGFIPSKIAAKKDPVIALRTE